MSDSVFGPDLNRPHRLSYFVRGPEWAIALPQGDLDALEDVMRRLSTLWNGIGTLLVPVSRSGAIPKGLDTLIDCVPPERFLVHDSLNERAREAVAARFGGFDVFWDRYDANEMHPLVLVDLPSGPKPPLNIPRFFLNNRAMRLATLACWGAVHDDDLPYWHERFDVGFLDEPMPATRAFVDGQTESATTSPLRLGAKYMGAISMQNYIDHPTLVVLHEPSFEQLLGFWNFRSRSIAIFGTKASVVGIPRAFVRDPPVLSSLRQWIAMPRGARSPDLLVNAITRDHTAVRAALEAIGFEEDPEKKLTIRHGPEVKPNDPPTYGFAPRYLGGRLVRGSHERILVALRNPLELDLPAPKGLALATGHSVRLTLDNLPLSLPITPSAAERMNNTATARDGLTLPLQISPLYSFSIRFPSRAEALEDWATDNGYRAEPSQDSRYADALLNRLGDFDALDALASPVAVKLLRHMAPQSRLKLAQALRRELEGSGGNLAADNIAENIKDVGLFLETQSRDVSALAGLANVKKNEALAALSPLVASGFVVRGHAVNCPVCNVTEFHRLDELGERVTCRACRAELVLPVSSSGGMSEPSVHYRLDGLMARVMDQDVLPVLLAVRTIRKRMQSGHGVSTWHGVVFDSGSTCIDVDVLAYNGDHIVFCECKDNGSTLTDAQFDGLCDLAADLSARPALACLRGSFSDEQRDVVTSHGGFVLGPSELFSFH